ncbi:hypothetical protein HZS_7515 [Henneguya salminicola]|nr:hypothetical protein HZS_7515 [Henneguya salminicola]
MIYGCFIFEFLLNSIVAYQEKTILFDRVVIVSFKMVKNYIRTSDAGNCCNQRASIMYHCAPCPNTIRIRFYVTSYQCPVSFCRNVLKRTINLSQTEELLKL